MIFTVVSNLHGNPKRVLFANAFLRFEAYSKKPLPVLLGALISHLGTLSHAILRSGVLTRGIIQRLILLYHAIHLCRRLLAGNIAFPFTLSRLGSHGRVPLLDFLFDATRAGFDIPRIHRRIRLHLIGQRL